MPCVFPDTVGRHVEATGEWSSPFGRGGGFTPVIGDFDGYAVVKLGDTDVSVEASVAVIARPLDDDGVLVMKSSADFQGEFGKVAFDFSDQLAARHDFAHLGPLALTMRRQGHAEDVGQAGLAVGRCRVRGHASTYFRPVPPFATSLGKPVDPLAMTATGEGPQCGQSRALAATGPVFAV
jgi:hypothetical protein